MHHARFRFYATLNDFLPAIQRQSDFDHSFRGHPSVKDQIEALGVPHTEVHLILANGDAVDFGYHLQDGDRISVYPRFEQVELPSEQSVQEKRPAVPRFVLDAHLGRLAKYLRILGIDTRYRNDFNDEELARIASEESRILLTRDQGLLKRSVVQHGYFIRATDPKERLEEIVERFDLEEHFAPLSRCLQCNGLLKPVSKEAVVAELLPDTRAYYDVFYRCEACDQIFWKGSHYDRMMGFIQRVRNRHS